ncbi:MAG TPA: phytanoyl-CoA dioxygenase family protein [Pirellulales bacterium]|nr:phytanoyl-CoA dioxygenase family protein [Pirellulales bacterium]
MTQAIVVAPKPWALRTEQVREYEADGHLTLRGLFRADEIAALADEAAALAARIDLIDGNNLRCRYQPNERGGDCLFETFDPVIDIAPLCAQLAGDRRILDALASIYRDRPCLFKDKLIFKPPGARGYGLHQDFIAWPDFPRSFVTVLVAIDATDAENGCTEVYSGQHHQGCLTVEDGEYHEVPAERVDPTRSVMLDLMPGDVAIFSCFTPHRSAPNRASRWRRQLYLSYTAQRDGGDLRERHYRRFHHWLRAKYAAHGKTDLYFR